jgi:hypothetical protein
MLGHEDEPFRVGTDRLTVHVYIEEANTGERRTVHTQVGRYRYVLVQLHHPQTFTVNNVANITMCVLLQGRVARLLETPEKKS